VHPPVIIFYTVIMITSILYTNRFALRMRMTFIVTIIVIGLQILKLGNYV